MNRVDLIGRLGQDPEQIQFQDGVVTKFSLATNEYWKGKNGGKISRTDWHKCVAHGRIAEIAGKYLKKGSLIHVAGKLQTRAWEDKDQKPRYSTEIVVACIEMLETKKEDSQELPEQGEGFNFVEEW